MEYHFFIEYKNIKQSILLKLMTIEKGMYHNIELQLVNRHNNLIPDTGFGIMLHLIKHKSIATLDFPEFQFDMPIVGAKFVTISGALPLEYLPRNEYTGQIQGVIGADILSFIIKITPEGTISINPLNNNRVGNQVIYRFNATYMTKR